MAQSATSFVNHVWTGSGAEINLYSSVETEIELYTSDQYDTYVSFLDSSEATNKIDEDVDYLTQSYLNNFKNQIGSYDEYTMRVKVTFDEPLSVNNQAVAFCVGEEERGVVCGTTSTGSSNTEATDFRTYWFSDYDTTVTSIKDDSPLDLWDSANDSSYIDDYYYGMTQYYLRMAASTILVGDKFQFREVSNEQQWNNVSDYRFKAGDTISVYRMQQSSSGTISWDWAEDRTLQGASHLMSTLLVSAGLLLLHSF